METSELSVLIAATGDDVHACLVAEHLRVRGVTVAYMNADEFIDSRPSWAPGEDLRVVIDGDAWSIGSYTTVWWRRPGSACDRTGDELEDRFISEEAGALFPGTLAAAGVRWVDAPWSLTRARLKPLQLAVAHLVGSTVPDTHVTGDPDAAVRFGKAGVVLAKAASTGFGIAPHVAAVPQVELHRVAACPTTLQRPVESSADLRVVTVGDETHIWSRPRTDEEPVDWRASDPSGVGFKHLEDWRCGRAVAIAAGLGLTFSVQDWLATDDGDVFLEVNPQGQWLFLDEADQIVGPALADHLARRA